jgi:SAM-dependent MidA family methyltransferase
VTAEFASTTENTALREHIVALISDRGRIPFRDFMDVVLYHPTLGYYTSEHEVIGRQGDYLTSPEVSPLFGAMIGRQLREMWRTMGAPSSFSVLECGAGNGRLATDILEWARRAEPGFFGALSYILIEVSEQQVARQRARLAAAGVDDRVSWLDEMPSAVTGCILSNELLDAMPVHLVTVQDGALREVYITTGQGQFHEELADPEPALASHFADLGILPAEGCRAEVNLASLDWMREAAVSLEHGFVLTLDYGYEAADLYAPWRTDGTLLAFYRHNPSSDLCARVGRQDLTAHVDFTSLRAAGESAGLTTIGNVTQAEFLTNLGIHEALAAPDLPLEEQMARRRAVSELTDPAGLGRIKVLAQARGVEAAQLTELATES